MEYESRKINEYVGNQDIFNLIFNKLLNKNLNNSIILYGNRGIGKASFVYYLSKHLFSKINQNTNNYNIKLSNDSNLIENNSHPNFRIIEPEYDHIKKMYKKEINLDQIRNLNNFLNLTSKEKLPKIVLIDSADQLNKNASNSLLKILEEPKEFTYFFLISHHLNLLLPTIKSRCIKFNFNKPNYENFKKIIYLSHKENIDETLINYLYIFSNSSPGLALTYLSYDINEIKDYIFNFLLDYSFLKKNLIDFSKSISSNNNEFNFFIFLLKFILINSIKYSIGLKNEQTNLYKEFNKKISYKISLNRRIKILNFINENENHINLFNLDKKLFIINIFAKQF